MPTVGNLIATGRTSEVFEYGPDRVVKLLNLGRDDSVFALEEQRTRAAIAAGVAGPAIHERIVHDGRPGLVFDRIPGEVMIDLLGPFTLRTHAEALGTAHAAVHGFSSSDLDDVREVLAEKIDAAGGVLPYSERETAKRRLLALPEGDVVLHGDFHPGNVLVSDDGITPIDFVDATRGHPAADVVRTLWLLSKPTIPPDLPRRRFLLWAVDRFRHRYQAAYDSATGFDRRELAAWRLPVLAGRLSEGIEHEEATLVGAVRALAR